MPPHPDGRALLIPKSPRLVAVVLAAAALLAAGPSLAAPVAPAARGGAVASAAPDATAAGLEILRAGGNAVDAAVATALALAVVHPEAGNLGGGGFAVVRIGGQAAALDFRETAPAAATPTMYLGANGQPVPGRSLVGPLAAGVPGSPAGLFELHRRFGVLPWAQVVAPAVRLARDGFVVTPRLRGEIAASRALLARFPASAAVWLPGGVPPPSGSVMKLPELAGTLAAYAERGPAAITTGAAAAAIAAASRANGGILTEADLAAYAPVWRDALRFAAFGWKVAAMPLPSSGGIIMGESVGMLERLGWRTLPAGSVQRIHLEVESWRRAYADRFLLGDPATTLAGPAQLLDPAWLARRAAEVDPVRATPSTAVRPWPGSAGAERRETTHLSVVDGAGNAVAITTTLNGAFGCGLLVGPVGFLLNNEMDDFATAPGKPNLYGLVQGLANAVGPGKRMLSSMAPTIAWRGEDVVALGSPGGAYIPTVTEQVLLAVIVDGAALQAAVDAPRVHQQWLPDEVAAEAAALAGGLGDTLRRRGYALRIVPRLGEVNAVRRHPGGVFEAAADPRGPGAAGVLPR
ncbi:MAG: gamma-glutamyltransferase [Acidobacteria bacterium]|nr:MAG: gamma-glutamyltransferase [Acidobacteriota bacterium]